MIKAVIFDIGETLVKYNNPLNWAGRYRPALERMARQCHMEFADADYDSAIRILSKYNTRINPREYEVTSDQIFMELLSAVGQSQDSLQQCKDAFFGFFRRDVSLFPEVEIVLQELNACGIVICTLSDVAYGMDNKYALADIADIQKYIQYPFTSNDIGYRKPNSKGIEVISGMIGIKPPQTAFVGDEKKDILCAKAAGAVAVLVNRGKEKKEYG